MTMNYYSGLLAFLLCLGLSEQYVKNGQWSSSGSFSSSSASSSASSFSSSYSEGGTLGKTADLLNDIVSGGGASANAVASADASLGATAGASAGAFANAGANAFSGSKASAGAFSGIKAESEQGSGASVLDNASGANAATSKKFTAFDSTLSSAAASGAIAEAGDVSNGGSVSSVENAKDLSLHFRKQEHAAAGESEKSVSGSFASAGAVAATGSKSVEIPTSTIKTFGNSEEEVRGSFQKKPEDLHYIGPFPGPKGSIFDSKPVPIAKYTGPFPGPTGSIYDSKPISHSTGAFSSAGASSTAGATGVSGTHYTGPFPGPVGSIFDSKPVPTLHTIIPTESNENEEGASKISISGAASASSQANAASVVKNEYEYSGKVADSKSLSSAQAASSSQTTAGSFEQDKSGDYNPSSQIGTITANDKNKYTAPSHTLSPVLVAQPVQGSSFSASHTGASSKAFESKEDYSSQKSFETPVSGVVLVEQTPQKPLYTGSSFAKDASAYSQSSAAEEKFTGSSFKGADGVVALNNHKSLKNIHAEAPADVVIVDHQAPKPVFVGSHATHFNNYGSHGANFGFRGNYGYHNAPAEDVVVLQERPRSHDIQGDQVILVEEAPVIMSGVPAGGVVLVEDQPKRPIYSHTVVTAPIAEVRPQSEVVVVEEKPVIPSFKPKEIITVVPASHPSTVPVGASCGFRTGCSGYGVSGSSGSSNIYKVSQENIEKDFSSGSSGSYKNIPGHFGSSYKSSNGDFETHNDRLNNGNVASGFTTSLDANNNQAYKYGAVNSGSNSAAASQAFAGSYGSAEKSEKVLGSFGASQNEDDSYKPVPISSSVPSPYFGNSKTASGAFHSNLNSAGESSSGFNQNFGNGFGGSATYNLNAGKASGSSYETGIHNYAKESDASNSAAEGAAGSYEKTSSNGAFATSGAFSGSSSSHGLLNGLLVKGLGSQREGENGNAVAGSGSFSSGGLLSSLLGKVKGLADGENASSSVSGSFSSSHSSASSSASSSSFAASSSYASSGSGAHY